MRIAEERYDKQDGNRRWDCGLTVVEVENGEAREAALDFCRDFFNDFAALAEQHCPGIVEEFVRRFPRRHSRWLTEGVTVHMGGDGRPQEYR